MLRLFCLVITLLTSACTSVPDVSIRETPADRNADYPVLAPLSDLLAAGDTSDRTASATTELTVRHAALQARAARLRRQPLD